jgi:uncharacterized membrane protein YbhN (UPF0104 family)
LQAFKVVVTLVAVGYVCCKLEQNWEAILAMWSRPWAVVHWTCFVLSASLMPVNYGLEAQKWRLMVRPFYPGLSMYAAVTAIFAGMAAGAFTPARLGEYAGRVLFLKEGKRVEAVLATFLDRICQLFVTLAGGLPALVALLLLADRRLALDILGGPISQGVLVSSSLVLALAMVVMLVIPQRVASLIPSGWNRAAWVRKSRLALQKLEMILVAKALTLAALRYLVFSTQYVLLLYAFRYEGGLADAFWMVALVFLGKSMMPVMGILELGAREAVALVVMTAFGAQEAVAIGSTLTLYLFNILLPTLLGVVAMQSLK